MINTGKVWNLSTEEKAPILSAKRNKHPFPTPLSHPSFCSHLLSESCFTTLYSTGLPTTSYFSFFSEWMLPNKPDKKKRVKNSLPKVFKTSILLEISSWLLQDLQLPDSAHCWCACSFAQQLHSWGKGASDIPSSSEFTGAWLGRYCKAFITSVQKGVPFIQ